MKKIISALLAIATIFCMCGCAKKLENAQPDGEIISNGGLVVQQGDWIYFINGAMPLQVNDALADTPVAKIYRMKADGSELQAVTSKKAHNMYIYKDKIFYASVNRTQVVLYCINVDGTGNKKLKAFNANEAITYGDHGVAIGTNDKIYYYNYETLDEKSFDTGATSGIKISK